MAKSKTSGDMLDTAERRAFVLALRKTGMTYRKIAASAVQRFGLDKLPKGWDELYAYKDVCRELERLRDTMAEDARFILQIELERLDRLTEAMWSRAVGGDEAAVDRVLRLMDRRSKYLGLDAKLKVDVSTEPERRIVIVWPEEEEAALDAESKTWEGGSELEGLPRRKDIERTPVG